ncbi:MAG TPA: hypothetical protein P5055_01300 [Candidatus Paceibacterota bacterium]|nr:hypothetical protein [Candidatus Paceibacterota bacterium]
MMSPTPFDPLLDPDARSVRTRAKYRLKMDPDGNPVIEPIQGETIQLSADGSLDTVEVVPDRFYSCGHSAQASLGGRCAEPGCGHTSCEKCFRVCARCSKPLCPEHQQPILAHSRQAGQEETLWVCAACRTRIKRSHFWRGLARMATGLFIESPPEQKP